jgi:hypothetical protein
MRPLAFTSFLFLSSLFLSSCWVGGRDLDGERSLELSRDDSALFSSPLTLFSKTHLEEGSLTISRLFPPINRMQLLTSEEAVQNQRGLAFLPLKGGRTQVEIDLSNNLLMLFNTSDRDAGDRDAEERELIAKERFYDESNSPLFNQALADAQLNNTHPIDTQEISGNYNVILKQKRPLWYAPDNYYTERNLPLPGEGASERYLKGALGEYAIYLIKSDGINQEQQSDISQTLALYSNTIRYPDLTSNLSEDCQKETLEKEAACITTKHQDVHGIRMSEKVISKLFYSTEVGNTVLIK